MGGQHVAENRAGPNPHVAPRATDLWRWDRHHVDPGRNRHRRSIARIFTETSIAFEGGNCIVFPSAMTPGGMDMIAHASVRGLSFTALAALTALATPAAAVDGVVEINQSCALSGGCFPGDAAGFPVTISDSGSYRLTGDLDVSGQPNASNLDAIEFSVDHVRIDLNGFSIIGPGTPGTGEGIDGFPSAENVTIVNGTVRGMGATGIKVDRRARIQGVTVEDNGENGINTDIFSIIIDCIANGNGSDGIKTTNSVVRGNVSDQNGGDGIDALGNSTVIGNRVSFNTGVGISLSGGSGYAHNSANSNTGGTISGGVQLDGNVCNGVPCP